MRKSYAVETFVFAALMSVMLGATVFLTSDEALAAEATTPEPTRPLPTAPQSTAPLITGPATAEAPASPGRPAATAPNCTCPGEEKASRPKFADYLDKSDEVAALSSIQTALSEMDDGAPFVWNQPHGRLSGIVRPTRSFRNSQGTLCRHVIVLLTTGYRTRTAEGVACRIDDGRWQLEG